MQVILFLILPSLLQLEEGEHFAKTVIDLGEDTGEFLAKGYLALGLTYSLQATDGKLSYLSNIVHKAAILSPQYMQQKFIKG